MYISNNDKMNLVNIEKKKKTPSSEHSITPLPKLYRPAVPSVAKL